jgi:hypothetical protein
MLRIVISEAAFDAVAASLPFGNTGYENKIDEHGNRLIWLPRDVLDRLNHLAGRGAANHDGSARKSRGSQRKESAPRPQSGLNCSNWTTGPRSRFEAEIVPALSGDRGSSLGSTTYCKVDVVNQVRSRAIECRPIRPLRAAYPTGSRQRNEIRAAGRKKWPLPRR